MFRSPPPHSTRSDSARARRTSIALFLTVLLLIFTGTLWAGETGTRYRVTVLPTLGGGSSQAKAVNNLGQVVGTSQDDKGRNRAFYWQDGKMQAIEARDATDINNRGQVVGIASQGVAFNGKPVDSPFLWQSGAKIRYDLMPLYKIGLGPKKISGHTRAINDKGQMVMVGDTKFALRGILVSSNGSRDIGDLGGGMTIPYDVNNYGVVVGYSKMPTRSVAAFIFRDGRLSKLPSMGRDSGAHAVNNQNQVVGVSRDGSRNFRAAMWSGGRFRDLGTLGGASSNARDINDEGVVVGVAATASGTKHAFVYRKGTMTDLNRLVDNAGSWIVVDAMGINKKGQIAGIVERNGLRRGVLLSPTNLKLEKPAKASVTSASTSSAAAGQTADNLRSASNPKAKTIRIAARKVAASRARQAADPLTAAETKLTARIHTFGKPPAGFKPIDAFATASPDFSRVAYTAESTKTKNLRRAVIDGKPHPEYLIVNDIKFSPDSKRVMYKATKKVGGSVLVVDGVEQPLKGQLNELQFTPDSKAIVYRTTTGQPRRRSAGRSSWLEFPGCVVWGGKRQREFGYMGRIRVSSDSRHVVHTALLNGRPVVVRDGQLIGQYDGLPDFPFGDAPMLSPNGQRLAFAALRRGSWVIHIDGSETTGRFEKVYGLRFSPDSKRVAYGVKQYGKYFAVVDGKQLGARYDIVYRPFAISPDSQRVAFSAKSGTSGVVVDNGVEGERYDSVGRMAFSPDSKSMAYWAKQGEKYFVVMDKKAGPAYDKFGSRIVFSPDSSRVAYSANRDKKMAVVVNGVADTWFDEIKGSSLTFSHDSRNVAYWARNGKEWFIVVNGKRCEAGFDQVVGARSQVLDFTNLHTPTLRFISDKQLRAIAVRGGEFVRIDVDLNSAG